MQMNPWLPRKFSILDGDAVDGLIVGSGDESYQIYRLVGGGSVVVAKLDLGQFWIQIGLLQPQDLASLRFGQYEYQVLKSPAGETLTDVASISRPAYPHEAVRFARCLKATRERLPTTSLAGAIYTSVHGLLLPMTQPVSVTDDALLGGYLTGVMGTRATSRRTRELRLPWWTDADLTAVVSVSSKRISEW